MLIIGVDDIVSWAVFAVYPAMLLLLIGTRISPMGPALNRE